MIKILTTINPAGSSGGGGVAGSSSFIEDIPYPSTNNDTYSPSGYTLIWSDEFNNNSIDLSVWSYETTATGWSQSWNSEWQDYIDNGTGGLNALVSNGMLVIRALKTGNSDGINAYTSARMVTHNKKSWQYGKIAARMILPYGNGIWPAFWLLGNNGSWPANGGIDVMEMIGGSKGAIQGGGDTVAYGTIHWDDGGHKSSGSKITINNTNDFHVYELEWTTNQIKIGFDNNYYLIVNTSPAVMSELRQPFYILLNLAVGGSWPGYPDRETRFPQYLFVDWVRVYQ